MHSAHDSHSFGLRYTFFPLRVRRHFAEVGRVKNMLVQFFLPYGVVEVIVGFFANSAELPIIGTRILGTARTVNSAGSRESASATLLSLPR